MDPATQAALPAATRPATTVFDRPVAPKVWAFDCVWAIIVAALGTDLFSTQRPFSDWHAALGVIVTGVVARMSGETLAMAMAFRAKLAAEAFPPSASVAVSAPDQMGLRVMFDGQELDQDQFANALARHLVQTRTDRETPGPAIVHHTGGVAGELEQIIGDDLKSRPDLSSDGGVA